MRPSRSSSFGHEAPISGLVAYIVGLALLANGRYLILEFRFGVEKITDRLTAYFAKPLGFGIGGSLLDVFIG
jgi:hypothetical protein